MTFAIIIPVYNAEEYIYDCLDSIISQTHQDWEAICVNDGSSDLSGSILNEYAQKDPRIKVFHKANGGVSSARNYALSKISSDIWVSFVDADDYLSPTMYEDIELTLEDADVDYIRLYCNKTKERFSGQKGYGEHKWEILTKDEYFQIGDVGGYMHSSVIKFSIIRSNNIFFNENLSILEDQLFSIQCALCSEFIMLYKKRNYFYYQNPNSITKARKDRGLDIINCVNNLISFCEKEDIFQSSSYIADYIAKKWLPSKFIMLIDMKFRLFHGMSEISNLVPNIPIQKYLPKSYKIKYHLLILFTDINKILKSIKNIFF